MNEEEKRRKNRDRREGGTEEWNKIVRGLKTLDTRTPIVLFFTLNTSR